MPCWRSRDLRGADLWFAKLPGARLKDAQLGGAILIEADLRKSRVTRGQLQGPFCVGLIWTAPTWTVLTCEALSGLLLLRSVLL